MKDDIQKNKLIVDECATDLVRGKSILPNTNKYLRNENTGGTHGRKEKWDYGLKYV